MTSLADELHALANKGNEEKEKKFWSSLEYGLRVYAENGNFMKIVELPFYIKESDFLEWAIKKGFTYCSRENRYYASDPIKYTLCWQ